jgi:DivIVA domain-containing protein
VLSLALYGLLAIVAAAVLYVITVRFLPAGEQLAPSVRDELPWALPDDRRLRAEDVAGIRLPVALRGYRYAETDELLDRITEELRWRDEEIARLRGGEPAAPPPAHFGENAFDDGAGAQ